MEASEVAEADEVNEAAEISKGSKLLLKTSESARFLNSAYSGVVVGVLNKKGFGRIRKGQVEF